MDGARFDFLTRSLTATGSRRRALAAALGGPFGLLGLAATAKKKKGKGKKKDAKKKQECKGFRPIPCGDKCCALAETCKKGKKGKKDTCVSHCNDGEKNFDETDTDCGGSCRDIKKCGLASLCVEDADCDTNVCVSRPDVRDDGNLCVFCRQDSDCGQFGPLSRRCFGNACFECAQNTDCPRPGQASGRTVCRNRTCIECTSATEAVDCGNAERPFCVAPVNGECPNDQPCVCGQCRTSGDCPEGQTCDETNRCVGSCTNGIQDGDESDIDCGGSCPKCADGKKCFNINSNCESGFCSVDGICTPAACGPGGRCCNGVRDGDESDIDCGGEFCPKCQVGQTCKRGSDCETFQCGTTAEGLRVCFPPA